MTLASQRRHLTALACGLWLFGFDLVPVAHMLFHEALDHHHHGHHHDDPPESGEQSSTPSEHGKGSVAHRDLAANVPLPAIPPVGEAPELLSFPAHSSPDDEPSIRRPGSTRARAPPGESA